MKGLNGMKVMFVESKPVMIPLLPKGFQDAGFEVYVTGSIDTKEQLAALVEQFEPHLVFTSGWGDEQLHKKQIWLREILSKKKIPHVYWSLEDPVYTDYFVVPLIQVAQPDFIFTVSAQHVPFYQSLGFPCAHLDWGIHPDVHSPTDPDPNYAVDIALIANSYYDTIEEFNINRIESMNILLTPLIQSGIRVDIWGSGWEHMDSLLGVDIPNEWLRGTLPYAQCNTVYSSAKIILGFQNVKTQVTQRTYEVLAAGGCLLTLDTPAVRQLFQPGEHLIVSNSPNQTLNMVKKYLHEEAERKKIGHQGRLAVLSHSYLSRVGYIMRVLTQEGIFSKSSN